MKFFRLTIIAILNITAFSASAIDYQNYAKDTLKDVEAHYHKIIEEYRQHLLTVPENVRVEITNFRLEISKLQSQKRDLYNTLSIQAQEYLKAEESFRQRLPLDKSGKIDIKEVDNIESDQNNSIF